MLYWVIQKNFIQGMIMPIYEYTCLQCGESFDKMLRFSESDLLPACPKCDGQDTRKKVSVFGFSGGSASVSVNTGSSNCGSGGGFS